MPGTERSLHSLQLEKACGQQPAQRKRGKKRRELDPGSGTRRTPGYPAGVLPLGVRPCRFTYLCSSLKPEALDAGVCLWTSSVPSWAPFWVVVRLLKSFPLRCELFSAMCMCVFLLIIRKARGRPAVRQRGAVNTDLGRNQPQRRAATCLWWLSLGGVSQDPVQMCSPRRQAAPSL